MSASYGDTWPKEIPKDRPSPARFSLPCLRYLFSTPISTHVNALGPSLNSTIYSPMIFTLFSKDLDSYTSLGSMGSYGLGLELEDSLDGFAFRPV
ncbi:hypothetical protein Acr_17g0001550 [Actinidia rufa]|uniref:Uncharacterized protein n=1 Tax=Actinidia rufa TaxID=165716 RepID=A0A7J0G1D2_9ERIC|nr:hypothetical protein Acr_17g0001550 [Actinidia rufa]